MTVYCLNQWMESNSALALLRDDEKLVDVKLRSREGGCVSAHRVVLAGASQFFYALFAGPCSGMKDGCTEVVELPELDFPTLKALIDAIYRQEVQVDENSVHGLLAGSNLLGILAVHKACCLFMQKILSPSNALSAFVLAAEYAPNSSLRGEALLVTARSFQSVREDKDNFQAALRSMSKHSLIELLASEHLDVESELEVFEVLCEWVEMDRAGRQLYLAECLVRAVRLTLMSMETLKEIVGAHPLVNEEPQSKRVVQAVQDRMAHPSAEFSPLLHSNPVIIHAPKKRPEQTSEAHIGSMELEVCSRLPETHLETGRDDLPFLDSGCLLDGTSRKAGENDDCWASKLPSQICPRKRFATVLLAAGGYDNGWRGVRLAETFDPVTNTWLTGPSLPADLAFAGSGSVYDQHFVVGGSTFKTHVFGYRAGNQGLAYWENFVAPKAARVHAGVTSAVGALYIIGGRSGSNIESTQVERYDPALGAWITTEPLPSPRSSLDVVTVREKIYAVGGQAGRTTFDTVAVYDPFIDTWSTVQCRMNTARKYHGTCACDGRIFAVGGKDSAGRRLSSVETFDPREGIWRYEQDLHCPRSSAGLASLGGIIYVAGGNAGGGAIHSSVEEFCTRKAAWSTCTQLNSPRSGLTLLPMR